MDRQAIIERLLDHYEHPRYHGPLADADVIVPGGIPDCGDQVTIYLKVDPGRERVAALRFEGQGCSVSQAAASILAETLQDAALAAIEALDDAAVLDLVGYEVARARPRCATLALHTLRAAVRAYRRRQRQAPFQETR
ncbi:MAG: iron-sulfur cluster assembly scaffold protein [Oscillochloridaceae bacterium]|nr:iron-sulfur cluster assembly scaffold protein [Chloroflexaceae bacterium]MDW8389865.1 iron-sulfur cluster assembly scaffold protein [Oscillochloridaceae bacterium]